MPETEPRPQDYFSDLPKLSEEQEKINRGVVIISAFAIAGGLLGHDTSKKASNDHLVAQLEAKRLDACGDSLLKSKDNVSITKNLTISVDELKQKPDLVENCDLSGLINRTMSVNSGNSEANLKSVSVTLPSVSEVVALKEKRLSYNPPAESGLALLYAMIGLVAGSGFVVATRIKATADREKTKDTTEI